MLPQRVHYLGIGEKVQEGNRKVGPLSRHHDSKPRSSLDHRHVFRATPRCCVARSPEYRHNFFAQLSAWSVAYWMGSSLDIGAHGPPVSN
jgi:hypothetical protein